MRFCSKRTKSIDRMTMLIMVIAMFACIGKHIAIHHTPPIMEDQAFEYNMTTHEKTTMRQFHIGYPCNECISNYTIMVDRGLANMRAWEAAYFNSPNVIIAYDPAVNIIRDYLHDRPWRNLNELYSDIYQHAISDNTTLEDMMGRLINDTSIDMWRRML